MCATHFIVSAVCQYCATERCLAWH